MAVRKQTTSTTKKTTSRRASVSSRTPRVTRAKSAASGTGIVDYFRFGESYTSLILGIVVVIISTILLVSFVRGRNAADQPQKETSSLSTSVDLERAEEKQQSSRDRSYTVKSGDDLWKIAEKEYNDGYKWIAIARANNIENPGLITAGDKLILPAVEEASKDEQQAIQQASPTPQPQQNQPQKENETPSAQGWTYTVKPGDYLWDIAVREYGDGYKWVEIARANNLTNPDVIHAGNQLVIPKP